MTQSTIRRELAVRTWDLSVEEFQSCLRVDPRLRDHLHRHFERECQRYFEDMSDTLLMRLRIPAMVLQDSRVVACYPDGLWQSIRKALRLPHRCVEIRLREVVTFPDAPLPEPYSRTMRVFTEEERSIVDAPQ